MTRDEITKLLELLCGNYNARIVDPAATADAWELILGPYSAEAVYKAARLHMERSRFFPNPAEIKDKITRAQIVYSGPPIVSLPSGNDKTPIKDWEPYLDAIWNSLVELEIEGERYLREKGKR